MKRVTLTASLLALAGLLTLPLFADDPAETQSRKTDKTQAQKGDRDAESDKSDKSADEAGTRVKGAGGDFSMPACLEKITLTDEQQQKIREIVGKYESEAEEVWSNFKQAYRDTIRTEVLLINAIEDNLGEDQQKQVREQRRMRANLVKMTGKTKASTKTIADPMRQLV